MHRERSSIMGARQRMLSFDYLSKSCLLALVVKAAQERYSRKRSRRGGMALVKGQGRFKAGKAASKVIARMRRGEPAQKVKK